MERPTSTKQYYNLDRSYSDDTDDDDTSSCNNIDHEKVDNLLRQVREMTEKLIAIEKRYPTSSLSSSTTTTTTTTTTRTRLAADIKRPSTNLSTTATTTKISGSSNQRPSTYHALNQYHRYSSSLLSSSSGSHDEIHSVSTSGKKENAAADTVIPSTAFSSSLVSLSKTNAGSKMMTQPNEEFLKQLECSVCFEIIPPPIQHCTSGQHLICSDCLTNLSKASSLNNNNAAIKCPTCRCDMSATTREGERIQKVQRCLPLERMAASLCVPCKHTNCSDIVPYGKLFNHLSSCDFRPVHCKECKELCDDWKQLHKHYVRYHPTLIDSDNNALENNQAGNKVPVIPRCCTYVITSDRLKKMLFEKHNYVRDTTRSYIIPIMEDITLGYSLHIQPFVTYVKERETFYFGVFELFPSSKSSYFHDYGVKMCYDLTLQSTMIENNKKGTTNYISSVLGVDGLSYRLSSRDIFKYGTKGEFLTISLPTIQKMSTDCSNGLVFQVQPRFVNNERKS